MMKFSSNHPWKFDDYTEGYFVGLLQATVVLSVEMVNIAVLNTNHTIMDVLMNFLALVIIADFDDYFFMTVKNDKMAKLISDGELELEEGKDKVVLEDLLKFEITTSGRASHEIKGNRYDYEPEEEKEEDKDQVEEIDESNPLQQSSRIERLESS